MFFQKSGWLPMDPPIRKIKTNELIMFDSTMEALSLPRRLVFHIVYPITKKTNCQLIQNENVLENNYYKKTNNIRMMD
jgi:hypothetical protein